MDIFRGMQRVLLVLIGLIGLVSLRAETLTLKVDGVERTAILVLPPKPQGAPLVFVFHGHGGTARHAQQSFHIETLWPEAIVVYPQGLPTKGQLTDPEGKKTGWQGTLHSEGDRDLHFFVALRERLQSYHPAKTYATGHSNGGGFSYLLLGVYPESFNAIAVSSAVCAKDFHLLSPKPILHIAGTEDPLVKYSWQSRMISMLKKLNGCVEEGERLNAQLTRYRGAKGNDLLTLIHNGGHTLCPNAPETIVWFFKSRGS